MKPLIQFLLSVVLALATSVVRADTLPTPEAVRKLADGIMGSVGAGNFDGTVSQLKAFMSLPKPTVEAMATQLSNQYVNVLVQFGPAEGSEFVRRDQIGESLIRLVYLAKYERSAVRWVFLFYKTEKGWVMNDLKLDGNLHTLFERG